MKGLCSLDNCLEKSSIRYDYAVMKKESLGSAIESGQPFSISMADGKEYTVPHRDFIAFNPKRTACILFTEDDHFHILPFITMTGIKQKMVP